MKKLNWERTNTEKKVISRGTQPATAGISDEMPLSADDLRIEFDPDGNRGIFLDFLKRIVEAEILEQDFPKVPREIKRYIQPLIDHYGGLLSWAKRTREYEQVRLAIVRKRAEKIDNVRRQFLSKVAKLEVTCDLRLVEIEPPQEIKEETNQFQNVKDWAHSQRDYKGIRKSAEAYGKRHWKNET